MLLSDNPQAFKDAGDMEPTGGCDDYPPEMDEAFEQERRERADLVREAQDLLFQAIEKLEDAVRDTEIEDNIDAYVIAHLKILASGDHGAHSDECGHPFRRFRSVVGAKRRWVTVGSPE